MEKWDEWGWRFKCLAFFVSFFKIRNMIKAACTGHKRCIPHPFLTHYTLMHCIRRDCCSPSGVLINSRELIECLSQCWRCPWDIPLSAQLTFWFICLHFALISLPAPFLLGIFSLTVLKFTCGGSFGILQSYPYRTHLSRTVVVPKIT